MANNYRKVEPEYYREKSKRKELIVGDEILRTSDVSMTSMQRTLKR